jgi:hypothetical protein
MAYKYGTNYIIIDELDTTNNLILDSPQLSSSSGDTGIAITTGVSFTTTAFTFANSSFTITTNTTVTPDGGVNPPTPASTPATLN